MPPMPPNAMALHTGGQFPADYLGSAWPEVDLGPTDSTRDLLSNFIALVTRQQAPLFGCTLGHSPRLSQVSGRPLAKMGCRLGLSFLAQRDRLGMFIGGRGEAAFVPKLPLGTIAACVEVRLSVRLCGLVSPGNRGGAISFAPLWMSWCNGSRGRASAGGRTYKFSSAAAVIRDLKHGVAR